MIRIAVVSPHFPVLQDPHYGQPIYYTLRALQQLAPVEMQVLCPLSTYPAVFGRLFTRAQVRAMKQFSPPGVRARYFGYPALPGVSRPLNGFLSGYYLLPHLRAFRPDVVLAYWIYPEGYGAVRAARRLGVPVIVGSRGSDLRWVQDRFSSYFVRQTLLQSAAVLTVSGELRDRAIDLGASPDRVHAVLNGCDSSIFHYRDRCKARAHVGMPLDAKALIFVGRISAAKGLCELVKALAAASRKEPALRLYCIGAGNFEYGAFESELRTLISSLELNDHVHFLGRKTPAEVAEWISAANVLCLPSHTEGCPNVVIEAIACGTPVVASNVGGIPELVNSETGILVPPYDEKVLAEALLAACKKEWDSQRISHAFSRGWDVVGKETLDICQKVLESHRQKAGKLAR